MPPGLAETNVHPAAGPQATLVTISGPYPVYNPDGSVDPSHEMFAAGATQLASNICAIEYSPGSLSNFSQSAVFACYPYEQPVGLFAIVPVDSPEGVYRSVNTPCDYQPPGPVVPEAVMVNRPRTPEMEAYRYRDKSGHWWKLSTELPSNPNFRKFRMVPEVPPIPRGGPIIGVINDPMSYPERVKMTKLLYAVRCQKCKSANLRLKMNTVDDSNGHEINVYWKCRDCGTFGSTNTVVR